MSESRKVLLQFEGCVEEVNDETFFATLEEPGATELQGGEIYLREVKEEELDRVRPGATFSWVIEGESSSDPNTTSTIRFHEPPEPFTEEDRARARREAKKLMQALKGQ